MCSNALVSPARLLRCISLQVSHEDRFERTARLEKDVNHQPASALAILRFGFMLFSRGELDQTYVMDMVDILLELHQVANACIILQQAIQAIGEAEAPALWERLLQIQSSYFFTPTSLNEEIRIERRYAEVNSKNRKLQGLLGSLHRYCQYGVPFLSLV